MREKTRPRERVGEKEAERTIEREREGERERERVRQTWRGKVARPPEAQRRTRVHTHVYTGNFVSSNRFENYSRSKAHLFAVVYFSPMNRNSGRCLAPGWACLVVQSV